MNQANWKQAKQIFYDALALAPAERDEFVQKACAGNEDLRQQVENLLEAYESGFLEDTAVKEVTDLLVESQIKIGQQLGRYKIESLIGVGGMGEVFLAFDSELKRPVALKVLHTEVADDKERINRFIQEAHAVSALNHPNILTIYEIGSVEGTRFIVSEYVKGETLRERLRRERLDLEEILEIAVQLSAALDTAHSAGIIHRDIKPENIILREDGLVKVLDFGLAKLVRSEEWGSKEKENSTLESSSPLLTPYSSLLTGLTQPGMIMGTVVYMSPEQAEGKSTDARTDLWSLGVVLYEMICGKLPFAGETSRDVIAAILKTETPSMMDIIKDIPPELESIISKTLEKDLGSRYQTAEELQADLKRLKKRLEIEAEIGLGAAVGKEQSKTDSDERNTEQIRHRSTLSREYLVSQVKQHKVGFSLLLGILILALGTGVGAYQMLSNGQETESTASVPLVAWYRADGNGVDSIGGNNGTLHNITFTSGHSGEAFRFNSGYFEIPNSPTLELQRLSISLWVKSLSSGSPGNYNYLFSMGSSNCNGYGAYQLQTDNTGGLRFGIGTFGGKQSPDAGTNIWDGNWHYVVGTYDGSFVRLFVDGNEAENGTPLSNHQIDYNTLAIKNLIIGDILMPCFWGDSYKFHGDLDDLKIYNRALSREEIQGIYTADKPRP